MFREVVTKKHVYGKNLFGTSVGKTRVSRFSKSHCRGRVWQALEDSHVKDRTECGLANRREVASKLSGSA